MSMPADPPRFCVLQEGPMKMEVRYVIGQVLDAQTNFSTTVSGGTVHSSQFGNNVSVYSTPIKSTEVKHLQLFLRTVEGEELDLQITNCAVGLRHGHWVTMLIGRTSAGSRYIGMINHNTLNGEIWDNGARSLLPTPSPRLPALAVFLLLVACTMTCGGGAGSSGAVAGVGVLLGLLAVFLLVSVSTQRSKIGVMIGRLRGALEEMTKRLRSQGSAQQDPRPGFAR